MSRYRLRTDSLGRFLFTCTMEMSKLTITANYFGYHSQTVHQMGNNDRDTITIDDFRLKMDEHLLGKVTVEGRARRFYMRGDTVVFNPEAFKTQDGARLIELIELLPGVSINDGKLLWNGEPLKLMMNGQQAFSEAMLTNVLPVEAVKDIKAYDRKSDFEERDGRSRRQGRACARRDPQTQFHGQALWRHRSEWDDQQALCRPSARYASERYESTDALWSRGRRPKSHRRDYHQP